MVRVDLESAKWSAIDRLTQPGTCRDSRSVPAALFATALRGYAQDVRAAVSAAGGDPAAAFTLRIDAEGNSEVDTRRFDGESIRVAVPRFPIASPLRRIDVSIAGSGAPPPGGGPAAIPGIEPL